MSKKAAEPTPAHVDPQPLLLASGLLPGEVEHILRSYGLQYPKQADTNLQSMAGDPHQRRELAEILAPLLEGVARTADPDQALNHWERLLSTVPRSSLLKYLGSSPRMLDILSTIFGNSDALAFAIIRDPLLIYWLSEPSVLDEQPHADEMATRVTAALENVSAKELRLDALRRFKRREMLRIGVRDLFRLATVPETTEALSDLASVLIHAAYQLVDAELKATYGAPQHRNAQGKLVETGFAVIGMGKLGGSELNYSSDVDVIYVYDSEEGETSGGASAGKRGGGRRIPNEEYFERLSRELTHVLTETTKEGAVFRVDLRLRAEGTVGQLARSLDSYERYYSTRGQTWERMALLKAGPIAGIQATGQAFLRRMRSFVLGESVKDVQACRRVLLDVRGVKDMIDRKMAARGQEQRNVKLGTGGIREIEFIVQSVQLLSASRLPSVWRRGTLASLREFHELDLLTDRELAAFEKAYIFLRDAEHKLQMVHDLQTHALPDDAVELLRCAIRLGYPRAGKGTARERMMADLRAHTEFVNAFFRTLLLSPDQSPLFIQLMKRLKLPIAS
ncbi:MAG: hypothetical protein U0172_05340 [Nitrospiraceae bacterium]